MTQRYAHGLGTDQPLVAFSGVATGTGALKYLYADRQGSVIALADSSGTVTQKYSYGPWGEPKDGAGNTTWGGSRFRYTGQTALPEAQLYYYKARLYDPNYGRFLQTDPIGSKDDLDLYAYTGGDPINRNDSSGERSYIVARRIFDQNQSREAGAAAAAIAFAKTHSLDAAAVAYKAAYSATLDVKHSFLVVTNGNTTIEQGQIDSTYSYGPEHDPQAGSNPMGNTVRQGSSTDTYTDDAGALKSIIDGKPDAGVTYQEIQGVSNNTAKTIFGAPSVPKPYNPVPGTVTGTTNSNSEATARAQAAAAAGGSTYTPPAGILPGAGQAGRVVCPNSSGGSTC